MKEQPVSNTMFFWVWPKPWNLVLIKYLKFTWEEDWRKFTLSPQKYQWKFDYSWYNKEYCLLYWIRILHWSCWINLKMLKKMSQVKFSSKSKENSSVIQHILFTRLLVVYLKNDFKWILSLILYKRKQPMKRVNQKNQRTDLGQTQLNDVSNLRNFIGLSKDKTS